MSNELAVIIASCITAACGIIVFFAGLFFQNRNNKKLAKEKLYYELYPRRLEVYNDFIKWAFDLNNVLETIKNIPDEKKQNQMLLAKIRMDLPLYIMKFMVYGTEKSVQVLKELSIERKAIENALINDTHSQDIIRSEIATLISNLGIRLLDVLDVEILSPLYYLDKKNYKFFNKVFKKRQKKKKSQNK